MDRDYIQLCAEMAYNEIIIMGYLNEDYDILNESKLDPKTLIEKIKTFFKNVKAFILKIYNKVKDFIMNKIKELKAKIEAKKQQKETKQESTNYDKLMNLVITENSTKDYIQRLNEGVDYDSVLYDFTSKIIDDKIKKTFDNVSKNQELYLEKIDSKFKTFRKVKEINNNELFDISKEFIEITNKELINLSGIKTLSEKIIDKHTNASTDNNLPSEKFLDYAKSNLDYAQNMCNVMLRLANHGEKGMEELYRDAASQKPDYFSGNFSATRQIYSKSIEAFNKINAAIITATAELLKIPARN